jgi:hypothetical protein
MDKTIEERVREAECFCDSNFKVLNTINRSIVDLEDALGFIEDYRTNDTYVNVASCLGSLYTARFMAEKEIGDAAAFVSANKDAGDKKETARVVTDENGDRFVEFIVRSKLNPGDYGEVFVSEQSLRLTEGGYIPIDNWEKLRILTKPL